MYKFQGIFTRQGCEDLLVDARRYTLRDLRPRYPFCGVRINSGTDEVSVTVALEKAVLELIGAGLTSGLALSYSTFGGPIEHLAGFEVDSATIVEASRFDSSSLPDDVLPALFHSTMTSYGLPPEPDGLFFPFVRSFWGE